jgi:hypothetical protein
MRSWISRGSLFRLCRVQQLVRFVIEQYRDELVTSLQGSVDESHVAEDREAVASDLLNILHRYVALLLSRWLLREIEWLCLCSIPIQSIATNGPSLVSSRRSPVPSRRARRLISCARFTRSGSWLPRCLTLCARQRRHPPPLRVRMPSSVSAKLSFGVITMALTAMCVPRQGTSCPYCLRLKGTICKCCLTPEK